MGESAPQREVRPQAKGHGHHDPPVPSHSREAWISTSRRSPRTPPARNSWRKILLPVASTLTRSSATWPFACVY